MDIDPGDFGFIAETTVEAIVPYLNSALSKAVDTAGTALGKAGFEKLTSLFGRSTAASAPSAQKALQELSKVPEKADRAAVLRVMLEELMKEDPSVAEALQAWLKEYNVQPAGGGQTVTGNNNKVSQISGSAGATVTIN